MNIEILPFKMKGAQVTSSFSVVNNLDHFWLAWAVGARALGAETLC